METTNSDVDGSYYFNVTTLCGKQKLIFWDDSVNDFGECFISLFLVIDCQLIRLIIFIVLVNL